MITWFTRYDVAATVDTTQKVTTMTCALFDVTTCLYFNPIINARSLSTLIAVIVNKDTEARVKLAIRYKENEYIQRFQSSLTIEIQRIMPRGSAIRPIQMSVDARLLSKSLDGE